MLADLSDLLVPVFAVLMSLFHVGLLAFKVSDLFLILQNSVLHHHEFLLLESDGLLDITSWVIWPVIVCPSLFSLQVLDELVVQPDCVH